MAKRVPSRGSEQFVLRLPDGMRDRIRSEADANGRSMNAEIIHRLEEAYELVDWRRHHEAAPDWSNDDVERFRVSDTPQGVDRGEVDPMGIWAIRDEIRELRAALVQTVEMPDGTVEATFALKKKANPDVASDDQPKK